MRVAILYGQPAPGAAQDDLDTLVQVEAIAAALTRLGDEPLPIPIGLNLEAARAALTAARPDCVFNLVEAIEGRDRLLPLAPLLLDTLGVPYAGAATTAMVSTTNKLLAKRLMRAAGLPTPEWEEIRNAECGMRNQIQNQIRNQIRNPKSEIRNKSEIQNSNDTDLARDTPGSDSAFRIPHSAFGSDSAFRIPHSAFGSDSAFRIPHSAFIPGRYLLKAVWEHASFGMDASCLIDAASAEDVRAPLAAALPRLGGEAFAERYIEGREFNLGLLAGPDGPELLPPAEIRFIDWAEGAPRLVDWRAKWDEGSMEYQRTVRSLDFAAEDGPLLAELAALARRCWDVFGLAGWARVDFRVDSAGRPWILEVNANPCLSPDAGFAAGLTRAGIAYEAAIARIVAAAVARFDSPGSS